jgi:hypothetical protein
MPAGPLSFASRWRTSTARPACKAEARNGAAAQHAMSRKRGACCLPDPTATWGRHRPRRVRRPRKPRARCDAVGCRTTKESKCTPTTTPLGESACVPMDDANSTARSVKVSVVFSANCRIRALSILRHGATPCCTRSTTRSAAMSAKSASIRARSVLAVGVRDAGLCGCLFLPRVPERASTSVSLRNHLPEKIDGLFLDRRRPPARLCLGQSQSAPMSIYRNMLGIRASSPHPDYRVTQTTE